jgi:hypothetical protein
MNQKDKPLGMGEQLITLLYKSKRLYSLEIPLELERIIMQ